MQKISKFILSAITVAIMLPVSTLAADTKNQGYAVDSSGEIVMSATKGLCWHTSEWTPARAVEQCDPTIRPVAMTATPAPATAPVAATPPALVAAPVAAKAAPHQISFSADALFAFDKAELKPEGRAMLDDLVRQLNAANYDVVVATGHTDRFGSARYNQKLSVRRADAVKNYLVSQNIAASRIEVKGLGETQLVTQAGECRGKASAKVIACLQPDRRVDVEMQGTRQ